MAKNYVKRESWGPRRERRERAAERTAARAQRTDAQQIALIHQRPGLSAREKSRLLDRMMQKRQNLTEKEIIEGGVAFITDTRLGGE